MDFLSTVEPEFMATCCRRYEQVAGPQQIVKYSYRWRIAMRILCQLVPGVPVESTSGLGIEPYLPVAAGIDRTLGIRDFLVVLNRHSDDDHRRLA